MTKHSKRERERRVEEGERVRQIEAAWIGSLPPAVAKAFTTSVEAARARGPEPRHEPKIKEREPARGRRDR
jgi:hypothetical protein